MTDSETSALEFPEIVKKLIQTARGRIVGNVVESTTLEEAAKKLTTEQVNPELHLAFANIRRQGGFTPACKKGCSHCCYEDPEMTILDLYRLYKGVAEWSIEEREQLREKCQELLPRHRENSLIDVQGKFRSMDTPCPLLDVVTGACRVYRSRPSICRGFLSDSAQACKARRDDTSAYVVRDMATQVAMFNSVTDIDFAFAKFKNLEIAYVSLTAGVLATLTDSSRFGRWWAGQRGVWDDVTTIKQKEMGKEAK